MTDPLNPPRGFWECSRPALVMLVIGLAINVAAWTQMPEVVPQHAGVTGQVDSWTSRNGFLAFTVISIVLFTAALLGASAAVGLSSEGLHASGKRAERVTYWQHPDRWPIFRPRLWSLMAWFTGWFIVALAVGLNLFALSPRLNLPGWTLPIVILGVTGAALAWFVVRMFRLLDADV